MAAHPPPPEDVARALWREFRAAPIGHHSAELARVLSHLRAGDVAGKFCLICVRPHAAWAIARLSGVRGVAPELVDNLLFASIEEAEWAIFKLRWRARFGTEVDEDFP